MEWNVVGLWVLLPAWRVLARLFAGWMCWSACLLVSRWHHAKGLWREWALPSFIPCLPYLLLGLPHPFTHLHLSLVKSTLLLCDFLHELSLSLINHQTVHHSVGCSEPMAQAQ